MAQTQEPGPIAVRPGAGRPGPGSPGAPGRGAGHLVVGKGRAIEPIKEDPNMPDSDILVSSHIFALKFGLSGYADHAAC